MDIAVHNEAYQGLPVSGCAKQAPAPVQRQLHHRRIGPDPAKATQIANGQAVGRLPFLGNGGTYL
jgi:hypothetical protein